MAGEVLPYFVCDGGQENEAYDGDGVAVRQRARLPHIAVYLDRQVPA